MKQLLLILFCSQCMLWGVPMTMSAQKVVTGTVMDAEADEPLIGANVLIKGTTRGTVTDFDGNYTIECDEGDILQYSYLGYHTIEEEVDSRNVIDVLMGSDAEVLGEVVVIGYGSMNSKDLTSSITTVDAEEIAKVPTGQPMQAIQGKVAGVQIVNNGAPGSGPTVRIRGIGSYPGVGNTNPLYVVDGVFYDDISFLNASDIATLSILKDASASAIYGVRAANGVVLIETKSGNYEREPSITYDGYYGFQQAQNVLQLANAEQFVQMAIESGSAADAQYVDNAMQKYGRSRVNPNVPNVNTDWYDLILRKGSIQNHSLSVTGGGAKVGYALAGSYFRQEGILDMKNQFERFNLRTKLDFQATDWLKLGGNVIISNTTLNAPEYAAFFNAYFAVPILAPYDDQYADLEVNRGIGLGNAQDLGYRGGQNPLVHTMFNNDLIKQKRINTNFFAEFDLIKDRLSFRTSYGQAFSNNNSRNVDFPYFFGNGYQRQVSSLSKNYATTSNYIIDNVLTYTNQFGLHDVTVMAGHSYRDEQYEYLYGTGRDFPYLNEHLWYISQTVGEVLTGDVSDGASRFYGISYFARAAYNYNHKYLVYATMRADGSSKYQEKWGYFPSVGVGWVTSQEDFFNVPFIDYLKIRASWGKLGNDKVPFSAGSNTTNEVTTAIDDQQVTGTTTTSTFEHLEWETVEETNVGLTAEFLASRLSLDADYYIRDTENAVIPVNLPAVGGSTRRNVGVIRNQGLELGLNWSNTVTSKLSYNVGFNFATLKNEVRDLYGQSYVDGGSAEFRQRSYVGEPLLAFYGREVAGVYQNQAEIDADPIAVANNLEPGDLKYVDQNGDGMIDDVNDRVILGSFLPTLTYGGNIGVGYANFDFSLNIVGQSGNKILNRKRGEVIFTNDTNVDADLAENRWHGEGTSNKYPSSAGLRKGWNQKLSDYFIEDGDFFRIQNVQLGYTLQNVQLWENFSPKIRIYVTADKPLTSFSYNGFNPEVSDGIDRQTYPIPATYLAGLNIQF